MFLETALIPNILINYTESYMLDAILELSEVHSHKTLCVKNVPVFSTEPGPILTKILTGDKHRTNDVTIMAIQA